MSYDVELKDVPAQLALTFRTRVTMATLSQRLGEAFDAVTAHVQGGGAQYAGPPFVLYPGPMGDEFELVLCMPVTPGAVAGESVGLEEIPGGSMACTMHRGPYARIGAAYQAVQEWMTANGRQPGENMREIYYNSPSDVPDEDLLTEVCWPVR